MHKKTLSISAVALLGMFGIYAATAKPEKLNPPKITKEDKIRQALKQAELKSPEVENEGDDEKKKILVFSKTNGFRHKSIEVGQQTLQLMADTTGAFDVLISDDLTNFDKDNIQNFDAICFLNTTMNVFSPTEEELKSMSEEDKKSAEVSEKIRKTNLMNFIEEGNGFIGVHSATDTFYEWAEYGKMIGGYFDGHPWYANMEVSIKPVEKNKNHALLEGVIPAEGELRFNEEIYQFKDPYDSSKVTLLLKLDPEASVEPRDELKRKDNDFGVSWIKTHKKGRVFYSSLGHNEHIYWNKHVLRHYYAGILYALGE